MPNAEESMGSAGMVGCGCRSCAAKAAGAARLPTASIHSYHSGPRNGWQVHRLPVGDGTAPTFGVEAETCVPTCRVTDLPGHPERPDFLPYGATPEQQVAHEALVAAYTVARNAWRERNARHVARQREAFRQAGDLSGEEAAGLAAPRGFWHREHDGSVSGPEFISHPATLAYWRSIRPAVTSMFTALLHGGVRAHDGGSAGCHVNIGRSAFGDAEHLARFAALVYANPRWCTRMAQRTHEQVRHWSRFDGPLTTADGRRVWAEHVMAYGYAYGDRYSALNANNSGRIEFRVPRGTLRVDRFYARLEWVASMVEYTRDASRPVQVSAFCRWASLPEQGYADLAAYLRERFPQRVEGSVAA